MAYNRWTRPANWSDYVGVAVVVIAVLVFFQFVAPKLLWSE